MISKKTAILRRLTEHLEAVAYTSTVPTLTDIDLAGKVYRGRTIFGDEVTPPFLVILEAPRQFVAEGPGESKTVRKDIWRLLLHGFVPDYPVHPTDPAYELAAYVEQRMARLIQQKP